ncbi:MAG TPA: Rieske 2Fe-2S domain-containing protein [Planctomycetaceae bacterium]
MAALLIAIPLILILAAILLVGAARRRDTGEAVGSLSRETVKRDRSRRTPEAAEEEPVSGREVEQSFAVERREASKAVEPAKGATPVAWTPPDPEVIGVNRRQFLNRSIVGASTFGLSAFGAAVVGFLWPSSSGGFGSAIRVGSFDEIRQKIADGNGFAYYPEGRMWITEYPASALDKARQVYSPPELAGMEAGFIALYQKCVHLGCRVPSCETSQWFECPCHGSQYNQVGEKKGGPAPRGLDRFAMDAGGGVLNVDTGTIIQGPPIGTNTTGQEAEGPHCVSGGGH